jgi:hypothetical protein
MQRSLLPLAASALAVLSACSAPTGQDVQQRFQQTALGEKLTSPEALEFREKVLLGADYAVFYVGEAALTISEKWKISKFPPMQPVIIRYGTGAAKNIADKRKRAAQWDHTKEHNYMIELANGDRMIIRQAGPQFHENQMATLIRSGLTVTLVP